MPQNGNVNFKIEYFDNLGRSFERSGSRNDYSIFESIKDRYGVYIFEDNNKALYIGESRGQYLKDRITQNYTPNDSGGGFRDNWCEMENQDFDAFKTALSGWRIITISIASRSDHWIHALEAVLIGFLQPKYNKS